MVARGDRHAGHGSAQDGERFALARFTWAAPDRLDVAGTFLDLRHAPAAEPALIVRGGSSARQLPPVPGTVTGPPRDGEPWSATFTWEDTPIPFDVAQLTFGDELSVPLPRPPAEDGDAPRVLAVLRGAAQRGGADGGPSLDGRVQEIRLETELLAAHERGRELQATAERAAAELARVQAELEAEQHRRAADAERYRDGLTQVRALAERTAAAAQHEAEQRGAELDAAREESAELRADLDAVRAALEDERRDLHDVRARLERCEQLLSAVAPAREDAQRVLDRLAEITTATEAGDGG